MANKKTRAESGAERAIRAELSARGGAPVAVVVACALGLGACSPRVGAGGVEAGADTAVEAGCVFGCDPLDAASTPDVRPNEAGAPDAPPDFETGTGETSVTCTGTIDEVPAYFDTVNNMRVLRFDASPSGREPPTGYFYTVFNPATAAPAPSSRAGACVAYAMDSDGAGSTARAAARGQDLGLVRFTHAGQTLDLSFMASFGTYGFMDVPFDLRGPVALDVRFPGAAGGPAGMATQVAPPILMPAMVRMPTSIARARDLVVSFDPASSAERLAFGVEIYSNSTGGPTVLCAVPSCESSVTVPAALLAAYTAGETVRVRASYRATTPVGPESRSPKLYLQSVTTVTYRLMVE